PLPRAFDRIGKSRAGRHENGECRHAGNAKHVSSLSAAFLLRKRKLIQSRTGRKPCRWGRSTIFFQAPRGCIKTKSRNRCVALVSEGLNSAYEISVKFEPKASRFRLFHR